MYELEGASPPPSGFLCISIKSADANGMEESSCCKLPTQVFRIPAMVVSCPEKRRILLLKSSSFWKGDSSAGLKSLRISERILKLFKILRIMGPDTNRFISGVLVVQLKEIAFKWSSFLVTSSVAQSGRVQLKNFCIMNS
jgi:hypothetical protein